MSSEEHQIITVYNSSTLKELYISYRAPLVQWLIKSYNVDTTQAIELTQSAFVIFAEKSANGTLPEFQTESNLKSYLFAIAKNKAREWKRQFGKTMSLHEGHLGIIEEEHSVEEEEKNKQIQLATTAFKLLGEKCQQLLQLAIVFKLSMQEIASQLNYENVNTAKTRKYKCLQRLRQLYSQSDR